MKHFLKRCTNNWIASAVTVALCLAAFSSSVHAQDNDAARRSLAGIDIVSVVVEHLPDGAKVLGLTEDNIQTDVELKLVIAGLHVVPAAEHYKLPGMPYLYINTNLTPDGKVASVEVALRQNALLQRKSDAVTVVSTWSLGTLMESPTDQRVRDRIKDNVDAFLTAWRAANTKN